jgi:hypothetical protein
MKPAIESEAFEKDYESWEASGEGGGTLAGLLIEPESFYTDQGVRSGWTEAEGYATRLDACWDFPCSSNTMPRDVAEPWRSWVEARGSGFTVKGPDKSWDRSASVYIGSRESDRMIRVYRWDLKHTKEYGPVIRVELETKGAYAKEAWRTIYGNGINDGVRALANWVGQMIGVNPQPGGVLPRMPIRADQSIVKSAIALLNSYGPLMTLLDSEGFDVIGMSRLRSQSVSAASACKMRKLRVQLQELGVDSLTELLAKKFTPSAS